MSETATCPPDDLPAAAFMARITHPFTVIEARSRPGERSVRVEMPSPAHKPLCASAVAVGSTVVLGLYPESATAWVATHDPARPTALVVLRVVVLIEPDPAHPMYDVTVRRVQYADVHEPATPAAAALAGSSLRTSGGLAVLTCPLPTKYVLCGGGFFCNVPVVSSGPEADDSLAVVAMRRAEAGAGRGWSVASATSDRSLVAFAVGIRLRKSAAAAAATPDGESDKASAGAGPAAAIRVVMQGGVWRAFLPPPHGEVVLQLGSCDHQDPAATALFVAPSEASRTALSKAPPTVWAQYHAPNGTAADRRAAAATFCKSTKR